MVDILNGLLIPAVINHAEVEIRDDIESAFKPVPHFGGNDCVGSSQQAISCNMSPCPCKISLLNALGNYLWSQVVEIML